MQYFNQIYFPLNDGNFIAEAYVFLVFVGRGG